MKRILLDQNIPRQLVRRLAPHRVERAFRLGWSTLVNGDLLAAAETAGFEIFITADQNIAYQQNLTSRRLAIIVLDSNRWSYVAASVLQISVAVDNAKPGSFQAVPVFSR